MTITSPHRTITPRHPGESRDPATLLVTPERHWVPAFAGMTAGEAVTAQGDTQ
jgi:hypothetical protein